jgi:putative RecB family exonuclease
MVEPVLVDWSELGVSGTPGIELGFDIDLDGVLIRGFIDAIIQVGNEVIVRDNKTGNQPGDDFQLGVYGVAISEQYCIETPERGDYWMGRSGKPTYPYDLTEWNRESVAEKFHELEENIQAERFDAHPDPDTCKFCDVSYSCSFAMA